MPSPDASPCVLLVDDEADILEILRYNFEQHGYDVHTARNGAAALARAEAIRPDLLVVDVMMPEMDGIELCRRIRHDPALSSTPILILTARTDEETAEDGLVAGADAVLHKPVTLPDILSAARSLLTSECPAS